MRWCSKNSTCTENKSLASTSWMSDEFYPHDVCRRESWLKQMYSFSHANHLHGARRRVRARRFWWAVLPRSPCVAHGPCSGEGQIKGRHAYTNSPEAVKETARTFVNIVLITPFFCLVDFEMFLPFSCGSVGFNKTPCGSVGFNKTQVYAHTLRSACRASMTVWCFRRPFGGDLGKVEVGTPSNAKKKIGTPQNHYLS